MELLRRLYRGSSAARPTSAAEALDALLAPGPQGGNVEEFLSFAAGIPHQQQQQTGGDGDEVEEGEVVVVHPVVDALRGAICGDDGRRRRALVKLLAKDTRDAPPDDRNEELGTAQAYHPLAAWLLQQGQGHGKGNRDAVREFVKRLLQLVAEEEQASVYYAAESALAAVTDAAHQKEGQEVILSLADDLMTVTHNRILTGVHLREDDAGLEDEEIDDLNYMDDYATGADVHHGHHGGPMGSAAGPNGEPQQLNSIAEAVLMLLNSRAPANQWFLYPGWNPGTLVFVLERLFGLYGDDSEIEHPALNSLIERMINLLHGEHNLRAHVAGNAACALSQLCRTKNGMARVLTSSEADSMSEAIARLLAVENLPPNNYTSRIVTKWVGNLAEAEEGAPWLFGRPSGVRERILSSLVRLLSSADFQTATEASHALAQLLLYSEPDTAEGDAQRRLLYTLDSSPQLPAALAELMEAGGDPVQNDGPLESGHSERYLRGYAAAEEACVVVAEMIYDKEGGELLLTAAPELVAAVYSLLSSRDPDCAIAGANVLSRMADLSTQWSDHLVPSQRAVAALPALLAHQSAHRHALPAFSKVLGVKGWLHALLKHEQFAILIAWLVAELNPEQEPAGGEDAAPSSSSRPSDAEAAWAANTLATIAAGSPEGASALLEGEHGEEIVTRLLALLRRRDTRHSAAAALGPLQAASERVRERLFRVVEGRGDGVALALLENSGVDAKALDEQLQALEIAEKRSWLATCLAHLHQPSASLASGQGLAGPVELECKRDQLIQHMCRELGRGQGIAGDLSSGVTIRFEGETGQGAAIRREWFSLTAREILNPSANLFVSRNAGQSYQPSPVASVSCDDPSQYLEVAGRVVGLALLHAVPLDCRLTSGLLRQLLEEEPTLDDFEEMDPEVYKHKVRFLLDNPYPDYLELAFTDCVDDTGVLSREDEVDLVPGGSERQVDEENKGEYVDALLRWRMVTAIADHVQSFKKGLHAIVPSELLSRMATFVTPKELSGMIAGLQDIDLEDWKANTKYEGEAMSSTGNQQVQWFWAVVEAFSEEERRALLQFATASPNVPVGGFGRLQSATGTLHPFTLSELTGRAATNTLPRAAACFNTLYLPAFESLEQMRQRVKIAVGMGIGHFDENAVSIGRGAPEDQDRQQQEEEEMRDAASASPAAPVGPVKGGQEETSEARGGREGSRGSSSSSCRSSSSSSGNSRNSSGGSLADELEAALHEPGGAEDVEEGDEGNTAAPDL